MESSLKKLSSTNGLSYSASEDPNQTISDDDDEEITIPTRQHNDQKGFKKHGRWAKQEQLLFLQHIVNCRKSIKSLSQYLPKRSNAQIKIHFHQFIQKCRNECSVAKKKQQTKTILTRISQSYGFQPSNDYLSQLETLIIDSPYDLANPRHRKSLGSGHNKKKAKQPIFTIQKTERKMKVTNIVTINAQTNHHQLYSFNDQLNEMNHNINFNGQFFVQNPFDIDFDTEILNFITKGYDKDINDDIIYENDHTY